MNPLQVTDWKKPFKLSKRKIMQAKKVIIQQPQKAELVEFNLDETLASHELLIQAQYTLISAGTEGSIFGGGVDIATGKTFVYPREKMGYANVGKVLAAGKSLANQFKEGDIVLNTCPHASHWKLDLLTKEMCLKIPDGLDSKKAVFTRMAMVSATALRRASLSAGDKMVVIGAGLVGNFAAQMFTLAGADVLLADISDKRLLKARECGVRLTINSAKQELAPYVDKWTHGRGAQIVVEAVGSPQLIIQAIDATCRNGEVILLGVPWPGPKPTDMVPALGRVFRMGISVKGSIEWSYSVTENEFLRHSIVGNCRQIMDWLKDARLQTDALMTHLVAPAQCQEAYFGLANKKDEYFSVVFDWK